jgi:hypothetical protein
VSDPKREHLDSDEHDEQHPPDGPHEIEDAAAQELEVPADEGDEG